MQGFLGIDIAKRKFDAVLLVGETKRHKVFDNDESGFDALIAWLGDQAGSLHACMEATGGLGDDLALFLHERKIAVSVVNPLRIKAFGQSEMVRTKTDKVDAGIIARFCRSQSPAPWQPPSPRMRELRALVRRCAALKDMRVQELQRRAHGISITATPDGGFVIGWQANPDATYIYDVYAKAFTADCVADGPDVLVSTYRTDAQRYIDLAALQSGNVVAGWDSVGQDGSSAGAYAKLLSVSSQVVGTSTDDGLVGGVRADVILAGDGNDVIQAGAGNDRIQGQEGNDFIVAGQGADVITFNTGDGIDVVQNIGSTLDGDELSFTGQDHSIFGSAGLRTTWSSTWSVPRIGCRLMTGTLVRIIV